MKSVFENRVDAENRRRDLKAKLDDVETEIDALDAEIQAKFDDEGITSTKCNGYTIFTKRDAWPKMRDKKGLVNMFLQKDEIHMLAVNSASLKSYLKENFPDGNDGIAIPADHEIAALVEAEPKYSISIRKA